jgi:CRP-like cAMP-binding protein
MELMDSIKSFAGRFVELNDEELHMMSSRLEVRKFGKKQLLTKEGEVEQYLNFVSEGLVRKFFVGKKGEMVMLFARERELISCYDSFLSGSPSMYSLEALEPTTVISVSPKNVEALYAFSPKLERLGRMLVTDLYLKRERTDYDRVRLSSSERFVKFLRENPDLLQRVPQKYIASYLNMKPETFSRLKHLTKKPV